MSNADFSQLPLCGDLDMRIARDGTWYYRGSPINRKPLVKLFSTVLRRENDGEFWLVTPAERGRVIVEDAPFTAVEVIATGTGRDQLLRLRTNLDEEITVDTGHPIWLKPPAGRDEAMPYVRVRPVVSAQAKTRMDLRDEDRGNWPPPGLDARILRAVYYHLVGLGVEHMIENRVAFGVWSCGAFFSLGDLAEVA